jgi:hypothetical protein
MRRNDEATFAIASFANRPEFINAPDASAFTPAAVAARVGQGDATRALVLLDAGVRIG